MIIPVVSAVGYGPTELAAFDAALVAAGVADRNLIYLSSVLPPASHVESVDHIAAPGEWGDRLYVVMAQHRVSTPGVQACAGIGWAQDATGRGLLVEHHADTEPDLIKLIDTSLDALCATRGISLPDRNYEVVSTMCRRDPVCALSVAVFQASSWVTAAQAR